jgi:hypothetical protein
MCLLSIALKEIAHRATYRKRLWTELQQVRSGDYEEKKILPSALSTSMSSLLTDIVSQTVFCSLELACSLVAI